MNGTETKINEGWSNRENSCSSEGGNCIFKKLPVKNEIALKENN